MSARSSASQSTIIAAQKERLPAHYTHDAQDAPSRHAYFQAYSWRCLVESIFRSLKIFPRIATQYERFDKGYRAVINIAVVKIVISRFDRARGLALAITLCGAGLGAAILPVLTHTLLNSLGWRYTYIALSVTFLVISLPLLIAFFFDAASLQEKDKLRISVDSGTRRDNTKTLSGPALAQVVRSVVFWKLAIVAFLAVSGITAVLIHFVPILTWKGMDRGSAAEVAGVIGIGSVLGRLLGGMFLDRINGSLVGAVGFSLPIGVILSLMFVDVTPHSGAIIALIFGLTLGCEIDVIGYLTSRHFGMRNFGTVFGVITGLMAAATGTGAPIAGLVYDYTGSYFEVLAGLVPIFVVSALLIASLGPYPNLGKGTKS